MKTRKQISEPVMFVIVLSAFIIFPNTTEAIISDVEISPPVPTVTDAINIFVNGVEGTSPVSVDTSELIISDHSLTVNIYLNVGFFTVPAPWSHEESVGTLPIGLYDLTVNTYENSIFDDTYSTNFQVVPEPTAIMLLAIGAFKILGVIKGIIGPIMA